MLHVTKMVRIHNQTRTSVEVRVDLLVHVTLIIITHHCEYSRPLFTILPFWGKKHVLLHEFVLYLILLKLLNLGDIFEIVLRKC
ncbi:hypothetical protein LXL04_015829 [Taraxacum kok-saghyz]